MEAHGSSPVRRYQLACQRGECRNFASNARNRANPCPALQDRTNSARAIPSHFPPLGLPAASRPSGNRSRRRRVELEPVEQVGAHQRRTVPRNAGSAPMRLPAARTPRRTIGPSCRYGTNGPIAESRRALPSGVSVSAPDASRSNSTSALQPDAQRRGGRSLRARHVGSRTGTGRRGVKYPRWLK